MATMAKRRSGAIAREVGNAFEEVVTKQAKLEKYVCKKLPDGCFRVKGKFGVKLIPKKTMFDFVLGKEGRAMFLDSKTFNKKTLCASDIDQSQAEHLLDFENDGFMAGYLVFFRPTSQIVFFPASQLCNLKKLGGGIKPEDGFLVGMVHNFKIGSIWLS